jgi:hypothetical protein
MGVNDDRAHLQDGPNANPNEHEPNGELCPSREQRDVEDRLEQDSHGPDEHDTRRMTESPSEADA